MEAYKMNILNMIALTGSMFLTQIETTLSILVLVTALVYNMVKLYRQYKQKK